jgi:hypothetical protein
VNDPAQGSEVFGGMVDLGLVVVYAEGAAQIFFCKVISDFG